MFDAATQQLIESYVREGIISVVLGTGGYVILFPFRNFVKSIKAEWYAAADKLAKVQEELEIQRQESLAALQRQGDTQIELLGKAVDTLGDVRAIQAETLGFLRGRQ